MNNITIEELLKLDNINIIDVREADEFATGHVPNAKNIPLMGIVANAESFLDINEKYYIICEAGGRSMMACENLVSQGYDVTNVIGGTSAYRGVR